jgi:autotransporter-associated beta strand protein
MEKKSTDLPLRGGSSLSTQSLPLSAADSFPDSTDSKQKTYGFRLVLLSGTAPPPPLEIVIDVDPGITKTHPKNRADYGEIDFGSVAVRKTGGGTFVISSITSRTGPTTVQQGTLVLANSKATPQSRVILAGGTVAVSAALQTTVGGLDF